MADYKNITVLLGFTQKTAAMDKNTEARLKKHFNTCGYEPNFVHHHKKRDIIKYLNDNRKCCHAILMESADDSKWNENELADLVDERDINIVIILGAHAEKGTNFLMTLYAAGITSAIFEGKEGVPEEKVAEFLIRPRTRKEARDYYGINTKTVSIRNLTHEMYESMCVKLSDPEVAYSPMARLLVVADMLNPYQLGDFLDKLPTKVKEKFEPYREYERLLSTLKEDKVYVKYRKPKEMRIMNDDKDFNEGARELLERLGLDCSDYVPEEKKSFFGKFKSKPKKTEEKPEEEQEQEEKFEAERLSSSMYETIYGTEPEEKPVEVEEEIEFSDSLMSQITGKALDNTIASPVKEPEEVIPEKKEESTNKESGNSDEDSDEDLMFF